jgi:hypothetical protein
MQEVKINYSFQIQTLQVLKKCYKAALHGEDDKKDTVLYFQWILVVVGIVWSMVP